MMIRSFTNRFPEFSTMENDYLRSVLNEAQSELKNCVMLGSLYEQAILYLAAHKASLSSHFSNPMSMKEGKTKETLYLAEYNRIIKNAFFVGPQVL